jgi:hypothetical protein
VALGLESSNSNHGSQGKDDGVKGVAWVHGDVTRVAMPARGSRTRGATDVPCIRVSDSNGQGCGWWGTLGTMWDSLALVLCFCEN